MAIGNQAIRDVLKEKNINHLYHANTVATTSSFFKAGGLLSRGAVEDRGLFQTTQQSDEKDKMLGIWYDVFFDSVDIHNRANELNKYGPVMFVFSTDLLLTDGIKVKITKDNPIRWNEETPENDKYFQTIQELRGEYNKGAFYQHLTICRMTESIPFYPYLEKIVIDNPSVCDNSPFENAYAYIQHELDENYPYVELCVRECSEQCTCKAKYQSYKPGAIWYKYRIE